MSTYIELSDFYGAPIVDTFDTFGEWIDGGGYIADLMTEIWSSAPLMAIFMWVEDKGGVVNLNPTCWEKEMLAYFGNKYTVMF